MQDKKQKITIYDISKEAGVSIATVSRVLNEASNVNPETRDKVLSVMEKMGYKPNAFARGLGLDSMKTIGILCADSSDAYLAKAVYYIEEELRKANYDSLLCCTGYESQDKHKALDLLISKKVDAAILVGSNFIGSTAPENKYIRDAADSIPVMLLNSYYDYPNVYSLFCDDFTATKNAAEYLINKNCKKILYLYNSKSFSGVRKLEGYKSALTAHDIVPDKNLIKFMSGNRDDIEGFIESITSIYQSGQRFDAVLASEDYLAIAAIKFASRFNIKIPADLSVIGYNNSALASISEPELSSIDNKLEAMSKQLVLTLLGVLAGKDMPVKTEYQGILVERKTT